MKTEQTQSCGIDVSKDTLDCYYNTSEGIEIHLKVNNDENGFIALYKACGKFDC